MDENKNSISDSTTSETFDTWTLVTENNSSSGNNVNSNNNEPEPKRIEILNNENVKPEPEVNIEELSDGISVISESESIEECHERFPSMSENLYSNDSHPEESDTSLNIKNISTRVAHTNNNALNNQISDELKSFLSVKKVASGFFYAIIFVVVLAFMGKIKILHDMTSNVEISILEERIGNLELHNNLLRAEIDILQKKVTYLTNQHQSNTNQFQSKNQKYQAQNQNYQESKINENNDYNEKQKLNIHNRKPDITSGCEDNEKYINGICVVIEENQSVNSKNKENMPKSENNFNKEYKSNHQNENADFKYKKENNEKYHNYNKNYDHKNFATKNDDHSAESNEKDDDYSFENNFKQRDKKDDYYKKPNKYDENKKDRYNSKEYKYDKSKEYNKFDKKKYDNDWHNKLMDSRENFRKEKSKEKDNWYVERGHSREEFRIFENDDYKKKGKDF